MPDELKRTVSPRIQVYLSRKNKLIHLITDFNASDLFVKMLQVAQKVFNTFCYDKKTVKIIYGPMFYLNYHEIKKLKLYQRKGNQKAFSQILLMSFYCCVIRIVQEKK